MCGVAEPNHLTSDRCPYYDGLHRRWYVDIEYVHSKYGTAVYVGMLFILLAEYAVQANLYISSLSEKPFVNNAYLLQAITITTVS